MRAPAVIFAWKLAALMAGLAIPGTLVQADICKWVDEQGVTHYAEECPDHVEAEELELQPPPSEEQVQAAQKRSEALLRQTGARRSPEHSHRRFRSLPLESLGPLPPNERSTHLQTVTAQYKIDAKSLKGQFFLVLEAREGLQPGAYLELRFPDPANPADKQLVHRTVSRGGDRIAVYSPESVGFKCWNYEVETLVYSDSSRQEMLGSHFQTIQSRVDLSLVHDSDELVGAIVHGRCPADRGPDLTGMSADQLDALCEEEREKRLGPERQALISECQAAGDKSDKWCERYWSDYGDAMRIDRFTVRPALYYDLPECVAARKAREEGR